MGQSYEKILKLLLSQVLKEVSIHTEKDCFRNGESGAFDLNKNNQNIDPVILIKWPKASLRLSAQNSKVKSESQISDIVDSWNQTLDAILTLAHEYGHYLSYKNKTRSVEYEKSLNKWEFNYALSKREKKFILNEERIAWSNAFSILRRLGLKKAKLFRKTKKHGLMIYRKKLKVGLIPF